MTARIIDGKALAAEIRADLRERTARLTGVGTPPHLTAVRVGGDAASGLYIRSQARACETEGILFSESVLPEDADTAEVIQRLEVLNRDPGITGILLVKPMGPGVDFGALRSAVRPDKDGEGIHPRNAGSFDASDTALRPCTAEAAVELALHTGFSFHGRNVVMVGGSETVGVPVALMALERWATITVCHIYTKNLADHTRRADCLFVAAGSPGLITADGVKAGAVVIDIGINRVKRQVEDGTVRTVTVGDVDFESVKEKASFLSPVPGGVGPMTVAVLLRNAVKAAEGLFSSAGG